MLELTIKASEWWDERKNEFFYSPPSTLKLEHSLLSISKWESVTHKPFLYGEKTRSEILFYIRCMTINTVPLDAYMGLSNNDINVVMKYIEDSQTATTFSQSSSEPSTGEIVTSEVVYYWMFSLGISKECERWHINRLLSLIRIFNVKNSPSKKMPLRDVVSQQAALNRARKKKLASRG